MTIEPQARSLRPAVLPTNARAARTWGAGGQKYDEVSRGIADAIEHAVQALDPKPDEHVLDVATGTGWAARSIAARGATVTGVDLGAEVIEAARALSTGIDFLIGDAEALPFPDARFDVVIAGAVLHFAADRADLRAQVDELWRVLAPGGPRSVSMRPSTTSFAAGNTAEKSRMSGARTQLPSSHMLRTPVRIE